MSWAVNPAIWAEHSFTVQNACISDSRALLWAAWSANASVYELSTAISTRSSAANSLLPSSSFPLQMFSHCHHSQHCHCHCYPIWLLLGVDPGVGILTRLAADCCELSAETLGWVGLTFSFHHHYHNFHWIAFNCQLDLRASQTSTKCCFPYSVIILSKL